MTSPNGYGSQLVNFQVRNCPDFVVTVISGYCMRLCTRWNDPKSDNYVADEVESFSARAKTGTGTIAFSMTSNLAQKLLENLEAKTTRKSSAGEDSTNIRIMVGLWGPIVSALETQLFHAKNGCFLEGDGPTINYITRSGDWSISSPKPPAAKIPSTSVVVAVVAEGVHVREQTKNEEVTIDALEPRSETYECDYCGYDEAEETYQRLKCKCGEPVMVCSDCSDGDLSELKCKDCDEKECNLKRAAAARISNSVPTPSYPCHGCQDPCHPNCGKCVVVNIKGRNTSAWLCFECRDELKRVGELEIKHKDQGVAAALSKKDLVSGFPEEVGGTKCQACGFFSSSFEICTCHQ